MEAAALLADPGNGAAVDVFTTQTLFDYPPDGADDERAHQQYGDQLVAVYPELCDAVDLSTSASRAARWRHFHPERALSHNKEGEKRRQKREKEDVSGELRKRRREQVQRCAVSGSASSYGQVRGSRRNRGMPAGETTGVIGRRESGETSGSRSSTTSVRRA